ncbi:MAG: PepSY domain-containing protein [Metallibacterium sp.]
MKPFRILLVPVLMLSVGLAQAVDKPEITLDQAVAQVQRETGGKVLAADSMRVGRREVIYRIKVITPAGVVKVVQIKTELKEKR